MIKPVASNASAIGFVSVLEHDSHYLGGLLLLNASGRPLEFHCTAPVQPTQSHKVLYGPTLRSFVVAESVVPKLLSQCRQQPQLVCTDVLEAAETQLADYAFIYVPVAAAAASQQDDFTAVNASLAGHAGRHAVRNIDCNDSKEVVLPFANERSVSERDPGEMLNEFRVGQQTFAISKSRSDERQSIVSELRIFADRIDLTEPFERVHMAICQSQGIQQASDADAH